MKNFLVNKWQWCLDNPLIFLKGFAITVSVVVLLAIAFKIIVWAIRK